MRLTWLKQRPTVLVLDDDAVTRQMVCARIKRFSDTIDVETEAAARQCVRTRNIDLAIVDLELPTGSGQDLIHYIRTQSSCSNIPIIVLTGNETRNGLESALRAGATSFLLKPLNWVTFGRHIQQVSEIAFRAGYMALHDHLTGLPNRVMLNERVAAAVKDCKAGTNVATYILDLDRFKPINDIHGHHTGDQILIEVGKRLRTVLEHCDVAARMGGDEFAVVQTGIGSREEAEQAAQRMIEVLSAPYNIMGQPLVVGTSIGVDFRRVSEDLVAEQLLRDADLALGLAKRSGRNNYRFFEDQMATAALVRSAMEHNLRQALAARQFEVHYQPIASLATGEITGFEALLRWNHPTLGYVAPSVFIPVAEESGLIASIGEWVLEEACAAATRFTKPCRISVNVSPHQVHKGGLIDVVAHALQRSGLPAERLELEMVETILLQDTASTLSILRSLQGMGVRIALDDFGTGYSSMSYLQKFPFDKIKIDRSFVSGAVDHAGARSIIKAVAALARGFSMTSTAEGVETQAQRDLLEAEGIDELQGYILGRPLPEDETLALLEASRARRGPELSAKGTVVAAQAVRAKRAQSRARQAPAWQRSAGH